MHAQVLTSNSKVTIQRFKQAQSHTVQKQKRKENLKRSEQERWQACDD